MGRGGVGVCPVPCNRRVAGLNLHQAENHYHHHLMRDSFLLLIRINFKWNIIISHDLHWRFEVAIERLCA